MKNSIILTLITIILIIIAYFNIRPITDFNPFNNKINIPNSLVESFVGDEMKLNKNTDKNNPLLKLETKSRKNKKLDSRNLLFTSAGDNTDFDKLWIGAEQNFDIMVVYYGDNEELYNRYANKVDYILKRKGSKFQNFDYIYKNHKDIIEKYDRFFILDDDIIFKTKDINEMFKLSQQYNFWICGPTYKNTPDCKISHPVTVSKSNTFFRYTDFVEVGVPLFNKKALEKFMNYYDSTLIGWGVDFLFIWACGKNERRRFALIDKITCINPQDNTKKNKREMRKIKNFSNESKYWQEFSKKHGIPFQWQGKTWETVKQ